MAIWLIAVSSDSHSLIYLWRPSQYQNLPPQIYFQKDYTWLYILSTARFNIEMQRGCFYMNVFVKITKHLQKSFDVVLIEFFL